MYIAELSGKLSTKVEGREDILTSNVFSFFKYTERKVFLKSFLNKLLNLQVDDNDVDCAEFSFWPKFDDNTEPDLILVVGKYYLLFEAKFQFYIESSLRGIRDDEAISGIHHRDCFAPILSGLAMTIGFQPERDDAYYPYRSTAASDPLSGMSSGFTA
ncbi:MAG: hypothetical protein Q8O05_07280 [Chloroflexota bacterium]|nr:hypothetical protein [Chloroflexota bacterium]